MHNNIKDVASVTSNQVPSWVSLGSEDPPTQPPPHWLGSRCRNYNVRGARSNVKPREWLHVWTCKTTTGRAMWRKPGWWKEKTKVPQTHYWVGTVKHFYTKIGQQFLVRWIVSCVGHIVLRMLRTNLSGKYPQWSSTCLSLFITGRTHSSGSERTTWISWITTNNKLLYWKATCEGSPSSRLVGIGTTTWELEALSSVTEPCNTCSCDWYDLWRRKLNSFSSLTTQKCIFN